MSEFKTNVKCENCHSIFARDEMSARHYNAFPRNVCRECGHHGFYEAAERWVGTSRLLKPKTWGSGYWESAQQEVAE